MNYIRHDKEGRVNIPTQELKDFVASYEVEEKKTLYPRDPSLDPQLVWKGKDEQDSEDLSVVTVPIYIQEKIHPSAIIADLKAANQTRPAEPQLDLFGDFNGIEDFEKKVDFYHHEGHWTNRMILGDSLLVMNSLAEKENLKGRVQCIYFDPPYGINFGSNWQVSTRKKQVGDKVEDATRQPEQVRAFRDTWKLGIHSYLGYLRDRLTVAADLLTEAGSVFVQIGDENVHLVRCLMDEILGSENYVAQISFATTSPFVTETLNSSNDYIIWYCKDREKLKSRLLWRPRVERSEQGTFSWFEEAGGRARRLSIGEQRGDSELPLGRKFRAAAIVSSGTTASGSAPIEFDGKSYLPSPGTHWKTTAEGMARLISAGRVISLGKILAYRRFEDDFPYMPFDCTWTDTIFGSFSDKFYVVQTAAKVIERCILMASDPGDLVLDPTCGSGTTAYVAEQWGRRWITIDTSRVALALARTRLMAGRFPYYLLSDSSEGLAKEGEITGRVPPIYPTEGDIRKGFVYKRVPHVTLGSIANNPDIKEGMTREEIDRAILRHADTELLYDQPYEDNRKVRVTGPFTVESLAPHRVIQSADENQDGHVSPVEQVKAGDFSTMILENLRKAGVQNTRKGERLKFESLEPYAGLYLHAKGSYTDLEGQVKTVAVSIGPEFGTVGPDWIKEAAKEAVKGIGFDLLIVCGFSFDGYATEEAKVFGSLTVLPVRMNNDLSMGEDLLKKTGAGNLFMVFGEPDLKINSEKDGRLTVEILGLDVYDPTTGQIRSGSTDDIAVWFVDTNYNGESFFVRHAYFLGADDPYGKLKRALRAEIDEAAWSALYATKSQPFSKPTTGKIAVKVINHYGDEVLKVYEVG